MSGDPPEPSEATDPLAVLRRRAEPADWRARLPWWVAPLGAQVAARPLAALGLVAVATAVVAAVGWRLAGGSGPVPPPPVPGGAFEVAPAGVVGTAPDVPAASPEVVVHAAGAVARPGIYRLAEGARVADLLDAAGGPVADADPGRLNLAAPLVDGTRVYVPHLGEDVPTVPDGPGATGPATGPAPVDLNTADAAALEDLPGVGPATAAAIIDHRTRHGRFTSVEALLDVRGIGPAKLEQLRPLVRV